jgi:hypothetical protein
MKVCYNTNILNENKDPLIPIEYPWIEYHVENDFVCPEGFLELSQIDFETMKSAIDISAYINSISPSPLEIAKQKISASRVFGEQLIEDFAVGNLVLGIVSAGKTEAVTIYLHYLSHYIENGSLYAAVTEIDRILAEGVDTSLAPFVTIERLNEFKNRINNYLAP